MELWLELGSGLGLDLGSGLGVELGSGLESGRGRGPNKKLQSRKNGTEPEPRLFSLYKKCIPLQAPSLSPSPSPESVTINTPATRCIPRSPADSHSRFSAPILTSKPIRKAYTP